MSVDPHFAKVLLDEAVRINSTSVIHRGVVPTTFDDVEHYKSFFENVNQYETFHELQTTTDPSVLSIVDIQDSTGIVMEVADKITVLSGGEEGGERPTDDRIVSKYDSVLQAEERRQATLQSRDIKIDAAAADKSWAENEPGEQCAIRKRRAEIRKKKNLQKGELERELEDKIQRNDNAKQQKKEAAASRKRAREAARAAKGDGGADAGDDGGADAGDDDGADDGAGDDDGVAGDAAGDAAGASGTNECDGAGKLPPQTSITLMDDAATNDAQFHPTTVNALRHRSAMTRFKPSRTIAQELTGQVPPSFDACSIKCVIGPPGTGKTQFIVTEVARIAQRDPEARIIVIAASNASVFNIYTRCRSAKVFGSLFISRAKMPVPLSRAETRSFSPTDSLCFSTLSGRFSSRLKGKQFTHVFVDEAGQIPESDISAIFQEAVNTVYLIGDPRQLKGVTLSPEGRECQHDSSLMHRLEKLGHPSHFLSTQRRCNPIIYQFANAQFYNNRVGSNQISPRPPCLDTSPLTVELVQAGQPTRIGTSWANLPEMKSVVARARALIVSCDVGVSIGILTPYTGQKNSIVKCLGAAASTRVSILSVSEAQGTEFDVVLLSVVKDGVFWAPEMQCVATTRARHALHIFAPPGGGWWSKIEC
jgi:hypothetical protein